MKTSLRSVFDKVKNFFAGEAPANSLHTHEFYEIEKMMKERGCNLEFAYQPGWRPSQINNLGIIVDDKTSVHEIMHAEGNLEDVHKIVTGRDLDRKDIKRYKPEDIFTDPPIYPGMF